MKNVKRIVALILCLMMTVSLCACGAEKNLRGQWECGIDVTAALTRAVKENADVIADFIELDGVFATAVFNFSKDGTYKLEFRASDSAAEKFDGAISAGVEAFVLDYYNQAAEMLNLSLDGLRVMYKSQGMDLDEEIAASVEENLAEINSADGEYAGLLDRVLAGYAMSGEWSFRGDTLTLTDGAGNSYELGISELTKTNFTVSGSALETISAPSVFAKK